MAKGLYHQTPMLDIKILNGWESEHLYLPVDCALRVLNERFGFEPQRRKRKKAPGRHWRDRRYRGLVK